MKFEQMNEYASFAYRVFGIIGWIMGIAVMGIAVACMLKYLRST